MKKLNSIFISILFLFPFLSFSNATQKKVAGVYLYSDLDVYKEIFFLFCEEGSVEKLKEDVCDVCSLHSHKYNTYYLHEDNLDQDYNFKKDSSEPKFLSKKELKNIFKKAEMLKKNDTIKGFDESHLYSFYEQREDMYRYSEEIGIFNVKIKDFFKESDEDDDETNENKGNEKKVIEITPTKDLFKEIDKNDDQKKENKEKKNKNDKWTNKKTALIVVFPIVGVGLLGSIIALAYLFFSKKVDHVKKNNTEVKSKKLIKNK